MMKFEAHSSIVRLHYRNITKQSDMHIACMSRLALGVALPSVAVILTPKGGENDTKTSDSTVANGPKTSQPTNDLTQEQQGDSRARNLPPQ